MPLVKNGSAIDDPYLRLLDGEPLAEGKAVLVPAERLIADAAEFAGRAEKNGVLWPNHRPVSELSPYLDSVSLVALHFPTFRDGRAYSQARLLRERYNFRGEIRATGDVLRDQYHFMRRAGFDAFEVRKPADVPFFSKSTTNFTSVYQPAADRHVTASQLRHDANATKHRTCDNAVLEQDV
jgi:uncharacterized protein (DUF934 family)